jgi:hypothetical protein
LPLWQKELNFPSCEKYARAKKVGQNLGKFASDRPRASLNSPKGTACRFSLAQLYRSCTEEEDDQSVRQSLVEFRDAGSGWVVFPGLRTSLLPLNLQGILVATISEIDGQVVAHLFPHDSVPLVQFLNGLAFLRVFFQGLEEAFGMDAMAW